jgi:hypothetical protein
MRSAPVRRAVGRSAELFAWLAGATLLCIGMSRSPAMAAAGSLLLTLAGLRQFASAHGYQVRRPGLIRAATYGCYAVPLAFYVRHQGRGLLFHRGFDPATGGLPDQYCVIALPAGCDERTLRYTAFAAPEDSHLIGLVPADALRFEHRRGDYVDAATLAEALRRTSRQSSFFSRGRVVA